MWILVEHSCKIVIQQARGVSYISNDCFVTSIDCLVNLLLELFYKSQNIEHYVFYCIAFYTPLLMCINNLRSFRGVISPLGNTALN